MSITATVKNDAVKLPEGVHLPDGTQVRLETISTGPAGNGWPPGYFARTAGVLANEIFELDPRCRGGLSAPSHDV